MLSGSLPAFDLDLPRLLLVATRWAWLALLLSTAGGALFRAIEGATPAGREPAIRRALDRLIGGSAWLAAVAWLLWVGQQAVVLADPATLADFAAAVPWVLFQSEFGHVALGQLLLVILAGATLFLGWGWWRVVPALAALGAVALEAGHLHAWAMEAGLGVLTVSVTLHLLAAAAWLGALLPLRLVIGHVSPGDAAAAVHRFSLRGTFLVLLLAATATTQGSQLLGGLPGLFGTSYGWMAMVKAMLFACLIGFAVHNRFGLAPRLTGLYPPAARRALRRSIAAEVVAGLVIVFAAATLSALQPGMHAQPVWPFSVMPSLAAVTESPDYAREVWETALVVALAAAWLAVALLRRRWRLPALALLGAVLWFAAPHFGPLLVPAGPTQFYRSPTGFSAIAIADGAALYAEHCARCHGRNGRGDGPDAAALPLPPADLTAGHLWAHSDGQLFGWLADGMAAPLGGLAMPGFAGTLDDDAIWHLIDYIRAHNAGTARAAGTPLPPLLRAPEVEADCGTGGTRTLSEFRGRLVRLAFQSGTALPPRVTGVGGTAVATLVVPLAGAREAGGGDCLAPDPAVPLAYAIATGLAPAALAGSEVIVDQGGWLRAVLRPGIDAASVVAELGRIAAAPLPAEPSPHSHPG